MNNFSIIIFLLFKHAKYLAKFLFTGEKAVASIRIKGIRYPVNIRLYSSDVYVLFQTFLFRQYDIDININPRFIIDGGGHIGLASLWFANKYPQAEILTVEPEDGNYQMLYGNTKSYSNIKILKAALWSAETKLIIKKPRFGHGNAAFEIEEDKERGNILAVTIDSVLQKYGKDHIDILKLDIEGSEIEIFKHSNKWLGRVKVIFIELHDFFRPGCSDIFYRAIKNHNFHEIKKGENVVMINKN